MVATKLSSALVAPSKVANLLDWRKAVGSVMALDISRKGIGMAVATHPDQHAEVIALRPISLQQQRQQQLHRRINEDATSLSRTTTTKNQVVATKEWISELEDVVRRHRVCAFVVNWPMHQGRMGEQCGKVLHVLDSVIDQSNSVVTRKRPFTLWSSAATAAATNNDDTSYSHHFQLDEWGRSIHFANAPSYHPDMYYSSKDFIRRQESSLSSSFSTNASSSASEAAAHVLHEWMQNHWEVDGTMGLVTPVTKKSKPHFCTHSVDEYNSERACLQSALL